jgi:hypothetical protein
VGLLILEGIGPNAEQLADEASKLTEVPVGHDPEFGSATFDSDEYGDEELEAMIVDALNGIDPSWREHLQVSE